MIHCVACKMLMQSSLDIARVRWHGCRQRGTGAISGGTPWRTPVKDAV